MSEVTYTIVNDVSTGILPEDCGELCNTDNYVNRQTH